LGAVIFPLSIYFEKESDCRSKMGLSRTHAYFTELTVTKAILYSVASLYVVTAAIIVMLQPLIAIPCQHVPNSNEPESGNTLYKYNPCRSQRYRILLGLTVEECEFGRRLVWAVVMGTLIGWERKQADRPAGIRTMALVALGSCLFSICSAFAFLSGPMSWDASRISAAIPSGVGFLGSALIFKHKDDNTNIHEVHGLTTAASVWLSAAVGIACAGGLYFVASLSTAIMLVLLRFGPRTNTIADEETEFETDEGVVDGSRMELDNEVDEAIAAMNASSKSNNYQAVPMTSPERSNLISKGSRSSEKSSGNKRTAAINRSNRPSLL